MNLTEQLKDLRKQMGREIPREILLDIGKFIKELTQSEIEKTSCQPGDRIPSFFLPNVSGSMISSEDVLARGHMVLSFYRGVW